MGGTTPMATVPKSALTGSNLNAGSSDDAVSATATEPPAPLTVRVPVNLPVKVGVYCTLMRQTSPVASVLPSQALPSKMLQLELPVTASVSGPIACGVVFQLATELHPPPVLTVPKFITEGVARKVSVLLNVPSSGMR